eukprot:213420-Pelagomonas_calceolata.AAC.9
MGSDSARTAQAVQGHTRTRTKADGALAQWQLQNMRKACGKVMEAMPFIATYHFKHKKKGS